MDFTTVVIDGEFWATTCVQVRGEPALRNALYEWADWEEDRGDPYSIATGLRALASYGYGPRAPYNTAPPPGVKWLGSAGMKANPWQWSARKAHKTKKRNRKNDDHARAHPSFLILRHFDRLSPPHKGQGSKSKRGSYPTHLAAYLDACYAVDPAALPVDQRKPYS